MVRAKQTQPNSSTDRREIWYDDAHLASETDRKLKFSTFENPRWQTAAILKMLKLLYLQNGLTDLREIWQDDAYYASEPGPEVEISNFYKS